MSQALVDSCGGYCGGYNPEGAGCWCDMACVSYGDCCSDYASVCTEVPPWASCAGLCGSATEICYCDSLCTAYDDCCPDYEDECVGSRGVEELATGGRQTCARMDDGGVVCWGRGQYGVLGYASTADITTPSTGPGDVALGGAATGLAAGFYHTCAILTGGAVRCWGRNDSGQLGYPGHGNVGDDETPASMPTVAVGGSVVQLAAGTYHTCALLSGGTVKCWGSNTFGQLGYPGLTSVTDPASAGTVNVGGSVSEIAAGSFHTCARLTSGASRCWGANTLGELGYGNSSGSLVYVGDNETPASIGNLPAGGVMQVDAGPSSNCAVFTGGNVKCWGDGGAVLGYGTTVNLGDNEPLSAVGFLPLGEAVMDTGSGGSHHCVLTTAGQVRCWGHIPSAGLGYGSSAPITLASSAGPVDVGGTVEALSVGYSHVCAVLSTGGVRCWGAAPMHGYPVSGGVGDDEVPATMGDIAIP